MKKFLLMATVVAMLAVSCAKETGSNKGNVTNSDAFMALTIDMPNAVTKAGDPVEHPGTQQESAVTSVTIVGFDAEGKKVDTRELSQDQWGLVNGTPAKAVKAFKLLKKVKYVHVIVNPTAALKEAIGRMLTYEDLTSVAIEEPVSEMIRDNNFLMTNDGFELKVKSTVFEGLINVADYLFDKEDLALNTPVSISVDRAMAKVSVKSDAIKVEGGQAQILGVMLNATNKKYFCYAKLCSDKQYEKLSSLAKYRIDPNFSIASGAISKTELNWKTNPDDNTGWVDPAGGYTAYCHENTMDAPLQDFKNTTSVLVKAKYVPYRADSKTETVVKLGESWFRYTFAGKVRNVNLDTLKADYVKADAPTKAKFIKFLNAVLGVNRTVGFSGEAGKTEVTIADLDAVENGGYYAMKNTWSTTNNDYLVEYFQKSVCYYEARILHDSRLPAMAFARWGVVRNNYYNISLDKVGKPGIPYIPGPEDPVPGGDDPDDEEEAYISVSITINPWTSWTQSVDLGEKPTI